MSRGSSKAKTASIAARMDAKPTGMLLGIMANSMGIKAAY
jgi:hypothetical protein